MFASVENPTIGLGPRFMIAKLVASLG